MDYFETYNQKSEGTFYSLHFTGRHICPPGHFYMGMRSHFLLHYIEEGAGMAGSSRANARKIRKGNCFLYPPHSKIFYKADSKDPWIYRWIAFSAGPRKRLMSLPGNSGPVFIDTEPTDGILPLLLEIKNCFERTPLDDPERDEELFLQILLLMIKKVHHPGESMIQSIEYNSDFGRPDYIAAAKDFINRNFQQNINCNRVAEYTGLERSYLSRQFAAAEGISLKNYLREIRMKEALRLLKETDFTISAVAHTVGYREYKGFARNFKARYGCTAGDIQKQYRRNICLPE